MPAAHPSAELLCSFVRPDERQTLFILRLPGGEIQIVEDAELWEEPHQDGDEACYAYYPTIFPARRFADLDAAIAHAREYFCWIDGDQASDGQVTASRAPQTTANLASVPATRASTHTACRSPGLPRRA
jgi:hypothetical protein